MPFGVVSWVGREIAVLNRGGYRRRGRGSYGVNVGRPIVTIRDCCIVVRERCALPNLHWEDLLSIALHDFTFIHLSGTEYSC